MPQHPQARATEVVYADAIMLSTNFSGINYGPAAWRPERVEGLSASSEALMVRWTVNERNCPFVLSRLKGSPRERGRG